ncbi:MAG: efflux RND transporter periplasmic adaptor subunit [Casimicrobium sp.]
MNKWWIIAGAIVLACAGGGGYVAMSKSTSMNKDGAKKDEKKAEVPLALSALDVTKAAPTTIAQTLQISGSVEAAKQAMVRSRHAGVATQMSKRAGDSVKQGELLARVDSDDLRLRIGEREAAVRQAQAALTVAESARNQQRSLADRGFISKAALDTVESNYVAARTSLETAQSQLTMAKTQLAETALTSPITGVIAKRSIEPGERISGEMQVFQIIDPNSLEVVVQIPAERAPELKIGQLAAFQTETSSGSAKVEAKLVRVVPNASAGARTIETRFALPVGSPIPAGAFLSGQLALSQKSVAVAVPRVAVRSDGAGNYLWAVQDGKTARVRVKIVDTDSSSEQVAIDSGLAANSQVLLLRGAEPREGQVVAMPGAAVPPAATTPAAVTPAPAPAPNKS